ncbi:PPOX class F420-dependent oxidoreductase [Branchiibius cervicis]|uniref:PPOX class F420-dependent oxidoreductase n=1 Tax=Branchiibius cervicis TaxID=908252 RepID=A0ABW2AQR6_9MICO
MSQLPPPIAQALSQPWHATMSTLRKDGQPVSVPTWYLLEGGRILVNLDAGRVRLAHLRRDPRVALSMMDPQDWVTHVSIQGHVVQIDDDTELVDIDRISQHYTGHAYPVRDRARVSAWIEIDRWHAWGRLRSVS